MQPQERVTTPQSQPPVRESLARLFSYLKPHWRAQVASLVFLGIGTAASLVIPLLVRQLLDVALPNADGSLLLTLVLAMAGIHVVYTLCMYATDVLFLRVSTGVVFTLRRQMHERLISLSTDHFDDTKAGQMTARIMGDVDAVQTLTTNAFLMLVTDSFAILLMLGFMACMSLPLTLIGVATLALLIVVFRFYDRRLLASARENRTRYGQIVEDLQEGIAGAREIKAFTHEGRRSEAFTRRLRSFAHSSLRMGILGSQSRLIGLLIVALGPVLVYFYAGGAVISGSLTIGTLVAFISYLTRMYEPVQRLSFLNVQLRTAMGAVERILAFLELAPSIRETTTPLRLGRILGEISFHGVHFRYGKNGGSQVLDGVSLKIHPGERVAIVGGSGAGKTTIAHLICRFYEAQEGSIRLDGVDLRDLSLADLRRQIGIVPQDTFLFHASVADNLRLGKPDASIDEIVRSARLAHADAFVRDLPDGYETIVGERGARLSGGQRQRLSIARAILKDPPIVIFDEATSSLDSESERLVNESMRRLMEGRTTIIISHRLSTVAEADRILVLDGGRIVEEGTHATLMELGGIYAQLYEKQQQEERNGAEAQEARDPGDRFPGRFATAPSTASRHWIDPTGIG